MRKYFLQWLKKAMPFLLRHFGMPIHDAKTGEFLGRIFVFRWKGRLRVVASKDVRMIPSFVPRSETKYWYQDLGFSQHQAPDFPGLRTGKPGERPGEGKK